MHSLFSLITFYVCQPNFRDHETLFQNEHVDGSTLKFSTDALLIFLQKCNHLKIKCHFLGKYVASFGDGSGRYKELLMASGLLKGYDSYDGAPFSEEISEGRVKYLDLTLPQYGLPLYDWIISLEVAEHIPREYENIYLDNIVRHAKEGVILSWARPGIFS